ncbi:hypothetical protein RFI_10053 [Reticulomyxa filosa]|uniref:Pre-mRNA-splicing factor 38 n=1 Tax=Reticulomyxa filosa TaxID=46433 RepID=X6NM44_RETFI|nr:hypothetical protein RFI_10053 [Reticulomyxa filosa]|eukprot:ETO27081.1 hypothetical protein RFI_10053 [Reticulomyxa filosa]
MANTTQKHARQMHGTNPQWLVDKMIRGKVYDSLYWKEHCFALTAELLIEKVIKHVRYVGGMHGGMKRPCEFLCLLIKLLQIQPKKEIIIEFIKQKEFKYLRILSAFYFRLIYDSVEIYTYLEPLLNDYRKIVEIDRNGKFHLTHVDEIIDQFLQERFLFGINLPHLIDRSVLEKNGQLKLRKSKLLELEKIDLDQIIQQFETLEHDETTERSNQDDAPVSHDHNVSTSEHANERDDAMDVSKHTDHNSKSKSKSRRVEAEVDIETEIEAGAETKTEIVEFNIISKLSFFLFPLNC